jgi:uncharacterized membrane protein HdeD (DUF308 family)
MILQEIQKIKQTTIIYAIVLAAIGILMILCPDEYIGILILILGNGMLITACVMGMDFFAGKRELKDYVLLIAAMFLGIMGLCTIFFQGSIIKVVAVLFGVLLIVDGLHTLVHALVYARRAGRKAWWVLIILSLVLMLFGVIIFANPWWDTPHKLFEVIGGTMLFASLTGLLRLILIWPLKDNA